MHCILLNGSPRGKQSNTAILLEAFQAGFGDNPPPQLSIYRDDEAALLEAFREADAVILAFPLYTDMMPGKVKRFIEMTAPAEWEGKRIGLLVQSGFPEAVQSSYIAEYFRRLAEKRKALFIGAVIRGGVEGLQIKPERMNRSLLGAFHELGAAFRATSTLQGPTAEKLRRPWRMNFPMRLAFRLVMLTGLSNFYWNYHLKANGAFRERFAVPYRPPEQAGRPIRER